MAMRHYIFALGIVVIVGFFSCGIADNNLVVFSSYREQQPGLVHRIAAKDLPEPLASSSADNAPQLANRPDKAWPQAPPGFKVELYASGLINPRLIRVAPDGDLFLAESSAGRIAMFRSDNNGKMQTMGTFARGLNKPFGIAFYPPGPDPRYLYVGNTDSVVRFDYRNGDTTARGVPQKIASLPGGGLLRGGGHWTRTIDFSLDGKKMYVSVGSFSNVDDTDNNSRERYRANILEFDPDGSHIRVYAWGIRNAVGIAIHPQTGQLWASVNERDGLGDNLPPDYITHIDEGGFYGWPWFYIGGNQDPRHKGKHPELKDKAIAPDILIQPHNASMQLDFCPQGQFPSEYHGDIFAAQHGSWNRSVRTGYEVIRAPLKNGKAVGTYQDFLTGFTTSDGRVWGRPVGVAFAKDGSLFVSDDGSQSIWRITHE
jgi:glucose/arabinose dehydrogenase